MKSPSLRRLITCLFAILLVVMAGCSAFQDESSTAIPTPQRPATREFVYVNDSDGLLSVTLSELRLSRASDTQVLAVLATGNGSPSYILYPSNQPGVPEPTLSLANYPLQQDVRDAGLWVLAVHHRAYPVSERIGQSEIARQLAAGFDQLQAERPDHVLAHIVAANENLHAWFGEIEVLGEFFIRLPAQRNWLIGDNRAKAAEGDFEIDYTVSLTAAEDAGEIISLTPEGVETPMVSVPSPPETVTVSPASIFDKDIPGYRRVIAEDFSEASSTVEWFIGSDPTYSANIVNGAYQILLTAVEARRNNTALSWGSIQDVTLDTYVVRARVRVLQEDVIARYGLWLHYQDDFNFLFFGVENTGRYRVARFQTGYTELVPWMSSPIVYTGSVANELEIRLDGDTYTMAINGTPLVTTSDQAFHEGRVAFFCYSESVPATCHLERIEIWIPENAPFPKPTDTPTP
jgi:hypothetical protein